MRLYIQAVSLALAVVTGCGSIMGAEAPERQAPTYPLQGTVEKLLQGTDKEKRDWAIMLPFMLGLTDESRNSEYQNRLIGHLAGRETTDTIRWLEKSLEWGCSYWGPEARERAANLWVDLKTKGMTEDQRARLLVDCLMPSYPFDVHSAARRSLGTMGAVGKKQILNSLRNLRNSFANDRDVLLAVDLSYLIKRGAPLELAVKDVEELSKTDNTYVAFVVQRCFVSVTDARAVEIALKIIKSPEAQRFRIKDALEYGIAACPGGDRFYPEVLRSLQAEPYSTRREGAIVLILAGISAEGTKTFWNVREDLTRELKAIVTRVDIPPPGSCSLEDLQLFEWYYQNRAKAKMLLEKLEKTSE